MERPLAEVTSEGAGDSVFTTGDELLRVCEDRGISVSEAMLQRERQWRSDEEIRAGALRIWRAMRESIERGTSTDRKSTRLNSSHVAISYAVFCLKKKKKTTGYTSSAS